MSYPKEALPKKPSYFKTLPDRIAQSPTGITQIPNSRFPAMAPLNPATFKSVYERAGFDVYRPPQRTSHKSAPTTPTVGSGFRSASASHLSSSSKAKKEVVDQKRNASTHFSTQHSSAKATAPPVPKLQIDAVLANEAANNTDTRTQSTTTSTAQTPRSVATAPADPQASSTAHQSLPTPQTEGYSFNKSSELPPLTNTPYGSARSPAQDQKSGPQSATSSAFDTQRSDPQSASSSRFDVNSQRSMTQPQSATSVEFDNSIDRSVPPQSAVSSRFDFYQRNAPQSATSSRFDIQTNSSNSSGKNDAESIYMSTQSFQHFGSTSNFVDTSGQNSRNQSIPHAISRDSPLSGSRETLNNTTMTTSGPASASTTPTTSRFDGLTPTSRSFPAPLTNASSTSFHGDRSTYSAIDQSYNQSVQSTGTVKYQPQSARTLTQESDDDDSDDELNLSSEDESDEESMKSAILSPDPNSRRLAAPVTEDVSQLQNDAAHASSSVPPLPPQHKTVPSFTVSDPEGNITEHGNPLSPDTVAKQLESRFSTRSSMYGNEDFSPEKRSIRESLISSGGYDDLPKLMQTDQYDQMSSPVRDSYITDDGYDNEDSNADAFEQVENQLETLGMNSSFGYSKSSFDFTNDKTHLYSTERDIEPEPQQSTKKPFEFKVHKVKESSTDTESIGTRSIPDQPSLTITPVVDTTGAFEPETPASIEPTSKSTSPLHLHQAPHKHAPGEGPCRKCGLEITSKPIYSKSGELSGQWHRPCFTCTLCDTRFNKNISCFVLNDEPYCEFHYHLTNNSLCQVCGHGIVGKCLENDTQDRYHADCLKCVGCSKQIDGDYVSVNGQVHCEGCAERYTVQGLSLEQSKIERRRTRLYFI